MRLCGARLLLSRYHSRQILQASDDLQDVSGLKSAGGQ